MQEAALSEVLRVILIILLIYFGLKLIIRWFGPMIIKYVMKRVGKQFEKKFGHYDQYDPSRQKQKEGEVTIEKKPEKRKKPGRSKKDVGEYIDYEEID